MKLSNILENTATLPTTFESGDDFMNFVYDRWPSRETHVEMQGGGDWSADIDGDDMIKGATYSESSGHVSWLDNEYEEIEFGSVNEMYEDPMMIEELHDIDKAIGKAIDAFMSREGLDVATAKTEVAHYVEAAMNEVLG